LNLKTYKVKLVEILSSNNKYQVFVFQSLSQLTNNQIQYINKRLHSIFFKNWFSHSKKIVPELLILHHHFIIISTCTRQISGCSIDSLVNEIKMIELDLNISLLDRTNIFYSVLSLSKEICADNYFNKEIIVLSLPYKKFIENFCSNYNRHQNILVFNTILTNTSDLWILSLDRWCSSRYLQR